MPQLTKRIIPFVAVLALVLAGCSLASEPVPAGPVQSGPLPGEIITLEPAQQPVLANGETIYEARCASCHGIDGSGESEMAAELTNQGAQLPDLTHAINMRSPADWYTVITNGTVQSGGLMPPWGQALTDAERWDVTYYLYTLSVNDDTITGAAELAEACGAENVSTDLSPSEVVRTLECPAGTSEDDQWAAALFALTQNVDRTTSVADAEAQEPAEDAAVEPVEAEEPAEAEEPVEESAVAEDDTALDTDSPFGGETLGIVEGVVTQADETPSAGVEVTINGVVLEPGGGIADLLEETVVTDEDGVYRFEDLPFDIPNSAYVVQVNYDGLTFTNGAMVEPGTTDPLDLPVTLFEHTIDPANVSVEMLHLIVTESPHGLAVTQAMLFNNRGDTVYAVPEMFGPASGSVAIAVPPEASGLQFEGGTLGGRFLSDGSTIYDTQPVYPGQHAVTVTYLLPEGSTLNLPIAYETEGVTVMSVDEGLNLRSDQLVDGGERNMAGQTVTMLTSGAMAAGDTLTVEQATPFFNTELGRLVPIVLIVAAMAGLAYVVISRVDIGELGLAAEASTGSEADARLAELDAAYEAGRINRIDYEAQRAALKLALMDD